MKIICDKCGKRLPKDPECKYDVPLMLVVKDEVWKQINEGKLRGFICPDCMIKIWGRKFTKEELHVFRNGELVPGNLWYLRRNNMLPEKKLSTKEILNNYGNWGKGLIKALKEYRCVNEVLSD